jgi:hypothetical protein
MPELWCAITRVWTLQSALQFLPLLWSLHILLALPCERSAFSRLTLCSGGSPTAAPDRQSIRSTGSLQSKSVVLALCLGGLSAVTTRAASEPLPCPLTCVFYLYPGLTLRQGEPCPEAQKHILGYPFLFEKIPRPCCVNGSSRVAALLLRAAPRQT